MNLQSDIERINQLIQNNQLENAEGEIQHLHPQTLAEHRALGHLAAIVHFRRGEILTAKDKMEFTSKVYGDNVNLLRDLMTCQYHLHDMTGFRFNLNKLEELLVEKQSLLSHRSLLECEMMVGKFLEEEARLYPAIEFYERASSRVMDLQQRLRTLIQRARWHALYEPTPELSAFYRELISIPAKKFSQDLHIELEHSLMLIELRLIGSDHAWQRVLRLGDSIPEMDQRLLCFDFLEGALAQDLEIRAEVLTKVAGFQNLDPFEAYVLGLAQRTMTSVSQMHQLAILAQMLPWASYLRLLCLTANLESVATTRHELNRKIQLIIRGLDARSQRLWSLRLKQALQSPEIRVEFSPRARSVTIQGRCVDLSKKKMGLNLLEGLLAKPELSVDEAIQLLWQASFSPEHYHRLRMGIHRLNTLINKVTGLGKIIEVDSQNVRLRPEVKIRHMDESFAAQSAW